MIDRSIPTASLFASHSAASTTFGLAWGTTVVVVVAIVAIVLVVSWFLVFNRQHPENAATHELDERQSTSEQLYGGADRPAGPDAETMDPDQLGGDQRPPEF